MQKQKNNQFLKKFRLLNSQEHTEEIIWSLSDSSEYEDSAVNEKFTNITNKTRILKRKRKKKTPNNLSNLNITVLHTPQASIEVQRGEISPILVSKYQKSFHQSPTITHPTSPVLNSKRVIQKSPILTIKTASPKPTCSIKKKLFSNQNFLYDSLQDKKHNVKIEINSDYNIEDNLTCRDSVSKLVDRVKEENTSNAKLELTSKVKLFFNNHFSSDNSSQNSQSISDIQTQRNSTKTSDEVEILTCKSRNVSINNSSSIKAIKHENFSDDSSTENSLVNLIKRKKKIRHKKGSLAYRLNDLIKKQNSCLSLWQHERFLAANSNFIIPKEKNAVFRIQKVHFQYGCYLLEAVDLNDDEYSILINNCYVSDTILSDTIIKICEPYKVVQYNDINLLINVCRFECSQYKA